MRSRAELVKIIIAEPIPSADGLTELKEYWLDCDTELAKLTQADILRIFELFLSKNISASEVQCWANRLECRDGVGFEYGGEGVANEALFWLANPEINYPMDQDLYERIKGILELVLMIEKSDNKSLQHL